MMNSEMQIQAYLDGELSADDDSKVERALGESGELADLRRRLEEDMDECSLAFSAVAADDASLPSLAEIRARYMVASIARPTLSVEAGGSSGSREPVRHSAGRWSVSSMARAAALASVLAGVSYFALRDWDDRAVASRAASKLDSAAPIVMPEAPNERMLAGVLDSQQNLAPAAGEGASAIALSQPVRAELRIVAAQVDSGSAAAIRALDIIARTLPIAANVVDSSTLYFYEARAHTVLGRTYAACIAARRVRLGEVTAGMGELVTGLLMLCGR